MAENSSQPPLTLAPEQMRRLGYQVVDAIVDALAGLRDRPPARRAGPDELAGLLHEPVPRAGADPEQVLRRAVDDVLGPAMRVDHPRFFAYVPIPSNYVGMLADALVSGFGVFAGTWQAASGGGRGRAGHPALAAGAVRPARDGRRAVRRRRLLGQPVRPGRGQAGGARGPA